MKPVWHAKSCFETEQKTQYFDCLVAEYVLGEGRFPLTEEATKKRYNVETLTELSQKQQAGFEKNPKLKTLFYDIESPLTKILFTMERNGILIDLKQLNFVEEEISKQITEIITQIYTHIPHTINLRSPLQVGKILAEQLHIPLPKTSTGQYATGEQILIRFRDQFPIIDLLLTHRELTKLQNTYVTGLKKNIADDGRIHTTYNQTAVITGRLSSAKPNLQNIPKNSDLGKQIKSCFVAANGSTFLSFDYSQQELRILAYLSQDRMLLNAFSEDKDIHQVTASQIFNTPYEQVTTTQRNIAKTINFGIVYGMGKFGLSEQLRISIEEADIFISQFYANFPGIKHFFDKYLHEAKRKKYIETILGRRRFVFFDEKQTFIDNTTRRELINFPIQGSAADFVKKAMVAIDREVLQHNPQIRMLLQIHDELFFEVENSNEFGVKQVAEKIKYIMSNVYDLGIPMTVAVKSGQRWGDMKAYK